MNLYFLVIDENSPEPPYEQVRRQISEAVDSGGLAPGDKLPPVRQLAADLGLAANTVAKAYKELEARGVVITRGRGGTVVQGAGTERAARDAAHAYVETMQTLGQSHEDAVALVNRVWGR